MVDGGPRWNEGLDLRIPGGCDGGRVQTQGNHFKGTGKRTAHQVRLPNASAETLF